MKFENTRVYNFERALHGIRHPMESYNKSDSQFETLDEYIKHESINPIRKFIIGDNDMKLAQKLIEAGSEHRKFMRQIFISVDITAPLYWWKEFDTYKVGTVANSTSTMHKLSAAPITIDCFEIDDYDGNVNCGGDVEYPLVVGVEFEEVFIKQLEFIRQKFLATKDKRCWKELIRWLPESWLQTRTITMSYETLLIICRQRKYHKLNEWSGLNDNLKCNFIAWAKALPYAKELIFDDEREW